MESSNDCKNPPRFSRVDFILLFVLAVIFFVTHIPAIDTITQTYSEEGYYVPAAFSYLDPNQPDPNPCHPPLGKMLIALSIKLFGTDAFGWRMGSLIFSYGSLVFLYLFGLLLFKSRPAAFFAGLLYSLDFLVFTLGRSATLDPFVSFFIIGALYFGYVYALSQINNDMPAINKWGIISAIFAGLATTVKQSGMLAFFIVFLFLIITLNINKKKFELKRFLPAGLLFFSIVILTYIAIHIPLFIKGISPGYMLYSDNIRFHYFGKVEHEDLMPMWKWPLTAHWFKFYSSGLLPGDLYKGVFVIGSYFFWWGFLIFLLRSVYLSFKNKAPEHIIPVISYLALYLFWLLSFQIKDGHFHFKGGYMFYMLPCVPFMCLIVAGYLDKIWKYRYGWINIAIYLITTVVFFYRYYPIIAGKVITAYYYISLFHMNVLYLALIIAALNLQLFIPEIAGLIKDENMRAPKNVIQKT